MAILARGQVTISTVEDGASAVSIFIRSHAAPSQPVGALPSGWNTNPDVFANAYGILWVCTGYKNPDGTLKGNWTKPVMYESYNSNLLWNFPWSEGSGSTTGFSQNGSPNYREQHQTPFGYKDVVWRGVSDGKNDADGGFLATNCKIDHTKAYRMSCWFKRTSMDGTSYLGANGAAKSVQVYTGESWVERTNFYFWSGDLPEVNKWYLLVGYMYGSGDTNTAADPRAGIYDPITGKKVLSFSAVSRNYPNVSVNGVRVYQYYCSVANLSAYFWEPRVDLLDGREPSIEELLKKSKDGEQGEPGVDANLLDWIEEWNNGKTQIGASSVITPKIFAGVKNSNNTITGVAIGEFSLTTKLDNGTLTTQTIDGIYGFRDGDKTFSVDSTGNVELGLGTQSIKYNAITGQIEFGSAVAMQWVGATYIDANGIFTGRLSADSITAIRLSATQITTGYISADRIATGSITATKLDANSIKASIINTSYINGLSCTFTKGKIGGWTIESGRLIGSNISLDNSNKRVAVYDSASSATSGRRTQLYYSSDTSFGFYTTDSAGAMIAQFGSANKVAGWNITSAKIHKNSIYLGSDGSVYHSSNRWRLANDGSGRVANGNISWDAAGNVTFSNVVSLQWLAPIDELENAVTPKLTKITSSGIYTGTLTASQITAGTISASRIDTPALKAELITATNINALTLTTTKGTIGGWSITSSYIKKNSVYLGSDGSIYNGSKWRLNNDGSGSIASGNVSWNAAGIITFSPEVSLNWSADIAELTENINNDVVPKITKITSTGIYTGTLTAAQVNAVAISATSITTGTLSVSRIAAGSIDATKLNADSIKANIINTSYINGLSCTFTRGTIGGWSIEGTRLSCGQLVLDDANRRIAVFATGSSSTSGQRTMLYYNSNSDYGFFSTNSSGVTVAQLGSTNRIAGWNLTNSYIYKNSIYLGSDGSIYHSSNRWRLANDGSGRVANGNISWDASGNVTFGSSVELQWKTDINEGQIYVRGTGYNHPANRVVKVNGITIVNNSTRGLQLTVLNRSTLSVVSNVIYDVYADESHCNTMATALNALMGDKIVIITSCDAIRINATLNLAIQRCGGNDATFTADRIPYAFVGIPTIGKSNGLTVQFTSASTEPYAEMTTKVVDGIPQGVNTSGKILTNITGAGIYTGTLTASQITAGTINAARIDVNSIKASVLTAANINALTLTTSKGSIGGWNITSSYIYKNSVYLSSDGSIYNGSKWKLANDGSGFLANGNISWTSMGKFTARNGVFNDVHINGSLRNAFVRNDPSIILGYDDSNQGNMHNNDNIVVVQDSSGWSENIEIPWGLENSGRRISLVNYKWHTETTHGIITMYAPPGKYFYEDGVAKSSMKYSRETLELLGYGDDTNFFGWIVINRQNIMTEKGYGKNLRVLAHGKVTGTISSAFISYKTFDSSSMTVSRVGRGKYKIYFNSSWNIDTSQIVIMLTGYGYSYGSSVAPVKASAYDIYSYYFCVNISDDASNSDGSFFFQMTNIGDWY